MCAWRVPPAGDLVHCAMGAVAVPGRLVVKSEAATNLLQQSRAGDVPLIHPGLQILFLILSVQPASSPDPNIDFWMWMLP